MSRTWERKRKNHEDHDSVCLSVCHQELSYHECGVEVNAVAGHHWMVYKA